MAAAAAQWRRLNFACMGVDGCGRSVKRAAGPETRMSMTVVPWRLDPQSPWKEPSVTSHGTRVIVVCQEGYSSSLSTAWLRELGMTHVADIEGGF